MSDRYLVVGNPIAHSRSPLIHSLFAQSCGEDIQYEARLIEIGAFVSDVDAFFATGGRGMNVTLPFKQEAFGYAGRLSDAARCAGAVNTLSREDDGVISGDNTDGVGLVADLRDNAGWTLAGKSVLMLGAGGAVRGVLLPLLNERPASLVIANRTEAKAQALADAFADRGPISYDTYEALNRPFDLIINGTSASLVGDLPPLASSLIASSTLVYDMAYGSHPTIFMQWALEHGAVEARDGLGMLVEQAAASFCIWRGVKPETAAVIERLRTGVE